MNNRNKRNSLHRSSVPISSVNQYIIYITHTHTRARTDVDIVHMTVIIMTKKSWSDGARRCCQPPDLTQGPDTDTGSCYLPYTIVHSFVCSLLLPKTQGGRGSARLLKKDGEGSWSGSGVPTSRTAPVEVAATLTARLMLLHRLWMLLQTTHPPTTPDLQRQSVSTCVCACARASIQKKI